jgi:hypothetical protein
LPDTCTTWLSGRFDRRDARRDDRPGWHITPSRTIWTFLLIALLVALASAILIGIRASR